MSPIGDCVEKPRLRVLLAEDNPINQKVAGQMLRKLNCHVDLASDGEEVLNLHAEHDYDLAFMDIQMPRCDGYEATAKIRKREREDGKHLIIIAMTANALEGDRDKCLFAGMDDYIAKPIVLPSIAQLINKWAA